MKFPKLIVIPMTALLLTGCLPGGGGGGGNKSSEEDIQIQGDSYYDLSKYDLNGLKGAKLQYELHRLCLDTHKTLIAYAQFYAYTDVNSDRNHTVDQISESVQLNEYFYTGKQVKYGGKGSGYEREHVWPCASSNGLWSHDKSSPNYVDGAGYAGGGSDLYHIRPCSHDPNNARGSSRFKEFSEEELNSGNLYAIGDGGPYTLICDATSYSKFSEPADEFKGDIARLLMYVYIHYTTMGNYNWDKLCGPLKLSDVIYGATEKETYETMVRWNELDPVSETEKLRNDTVQGIQGNRNPFVDYPHLMKKCFNL